MSAAPDYAADPDGWADARRAETRAQQGLPDVCSDPVAAAQIADNVGPWLDEQRTAGRPVSVDDAWRAGEEDAADDRPLDVAEAGAIARRAGRPAADAVRAAIDRTGDKGAEPAA